MSEIFFYASHRTLHIPILYKLCHKKHHDLKAPIGFAATYTTILDFYFGNAIPIYLPLYLIGCDPITVKIWIIYTTASTVIFSHSGFDGMSNFHDKHHQEFNKNYGSGLFMDTICGTL